MCNQWNEDANIETCCVKQWLRKDAARWRTWTQAALQAAREARTEKAVKSGGMTLSQMTRWIVVTRLQEAFLTVEVDRADTMEEALVREAICRVYWQDVAAELLREAVGMAKNVPDRWLNRFVMNQARFAVGEVAATPGAADRLTVKELNELVARHERGDWGLVDFEEQQANERALDEGGELRSVYVASDGTPFQVLTTADRSTTTVSLLKVFETFSNDDDTDQPQRSGSRDEPVATTVEVNEPSYFGGCPECGKNDGYLNVGRTHWFICHAHRTRWWGGENLFSCWRGQNESEWQENVERLRPYAKVKPLMGDATARRKPVAWKEESGPTSKTSCVGCGSQDGD